MAKICEGCEYWKSLSVTSGGGIYACHCLLETGIRNGLDGEKCSTYNPKSNRKKAKKKGCEFFAGHHNGS